MARVVVFGTFDVVHVGHIRYLEQAKKLGDELVVVVSRDSNSRKIKGHETLISERHRLEVVSALRMVDKAILGNSKDRFGKLVSLKPDVVALGYDQAADLEKLRARLENAKLNPKIVRMKPYKGRVMKSSKIKKCLGL